MFTSRAYSTIAVILCVVCLLIAFYWHFFATVRKPGSHPQLDKRFILDFVPRPPARFTDCDDLFTGGTALDQFNMSSHYWSLYGEFQSATGKYQYVEGHSGSVIKQTMALHYLAARPSIRNVCETGFNLGHSSFNFLTANSKVIVHSFDIGTHNYSGEMSMFMMKHFPSRFFIHFGDSTETLPRFIRENPKFRCDLIFIDGGHTLAIATADLENAVSICNRSNGDNVIIFDDYPAFASWSYEIASAWENLIRQHSIVELMRCMYKHDIKSVPSYEYVMKQYIRGFVIGTMIQR